MLPCPLPVIEVQVRRKARWILVDMGSSTAVVTLIMVNNCNGERSMVVFNEREVRCRGTNFVQLSMCGMQLGISAIVADSVISGVDRVMGMDTNGLFGGRASQSVRLGYSSCLEGRTVT